MSRWRYRCCRACGGDLFFTSDDFEHYWECLQCGRHQDGDDKFAKLPKVDSRWRLVVPKCKQGVLK
jgi:hypothetical protein